MEIDKNDIYSIKKICKCGCGNLIVIKEFHKWIGIPSYILGHNAKGNNNPAKGNGIGIKITKAKTGKKRPPCSKETRAKCKKATEDTWKDKEIRENRIKGIRIAQSKDEYRKIRAEEMFRRWKNPDWIAKVKNRFQTEPNRPETFLLNLLNELYHKEWMFTGDFSFMINGKNPDFVNCNGQKKVIELYGDYWHRNDNPQDRIDIFAKYGYKTLIVWEKELKDRDKLIEKLKIFCNDKNDNNPKYKDE